MRVVFASVGLALAAVAMAADGGAVDAGRLEIFDRDNLVAWCIVPFDARQRGPEARAEMLTRMGIFKLAYDWRPEHIPTFDEELATLKRWGIKLQAFWFPWGLNEEAQTILDALRRHDIKTELWVTTNGGEIVCTPEEHARRVEEIAAQLRPIVEAAARDGHKVGLYNHGGWFGEPENQIAIIKALGATNVGIIYNLHHGHHHLDRFPAMLETMKPHLYFFCLNGMVKDGDQIGKKILLVGSGDLDLALLRAVAQSGYTGPIGVLGHTMDDAEETLLDNLDGLEWLVAQLRGEDPGPRPPLRVGRAEAAQAVPSVSDVFGKALAGGTVAEGSEAYRKPPLTVELRARLNSAGNYNILVACDPKASWSHWELFTEAGAGTLSVYAPGLEPDHVRSDHAICDGEWRHIAMQYERERIRLFVDGAMVAEQAVTPTQGPWMPGGLGIGRLVEGILSCDGEIDDLRITKGIRPVVVEATPVFHDENALAVWDFNDLPARSSALPPEPEDPARRAALPEYLIIPAADPGTLTPAQDVPREYYTTWHRSHGDNHNTRYAAFSQINRENVHRLKPAWDYRSGDEIGNVQCNPIVVDGIMYAPTSGQNVVAVDATTGKEKWRFDPEGKPAFRGLLYWPGIDNRKPRLFFSAGEHLYALNPKTGKPIKSFGDGGRVASGESRVAPAVHKNVLIVPGYLQDVYGHDVITGQRLWTFHTIPRDGEYGRDTWYELEEGANCWGGMALDDGRGIAYISTGSPKPNFTGNTHRGQNLFANCVIALNALTGERLWHFQEIRHDIWDIDIPAPPNLLSIDWHGRRVDVVAQTTKLGNTLVLDRVTGAPLYPFRLRRAPVSGLPGERTWPYQPDVELPEPFARQAFTLDDVTERTPEAKQHVMSRIANVRYGWFETFTENVPTVLYNIHGGAEWTGAAVDPERGLLYVSANNIPWLITVFEPDIVERKPNEPPTRGQLVYQEHCEECHGPGRFGVGMYPPLHGLPRRTNDQEVRELLRTGRNLMPKPDDTLAEADIQPLLDFLFLRDVPEGAVKQSTEWPRRYTHNGYPKLLDHDGYPGSKPPWGTLNCINLQTGKIVWQVPLGTYPDLAAWGEDDTGAENFGGPSLTAGGLVFCAGTPDNMIRAFDADTGAILWEHTLPFGGYAPPTVYNVNGKEFIVIPATGGGKLGTEMGDAYLAFALEP